MSYGFGVVGEGVGAWTEGVRQNQEAEARKEERRINQLYTRYQLSAERRKDAEQQYREHASAVGDAASGSEQEAEVHNARDEERKMRSALYETLSGKGTQPKGMPKGPKGWLYRAMGMDETKKPTEQGYDTSPKSEKSLSTPRIGSDQQQMPSALGTQRQYSLSPPPATTPAETAPGTAPAIKAQTLHAMATTRPIAGAEQIPQEVEEPDRGQFAPEGRIQAGLNYEWAKDAPAPRSGSEIRSYMGRKLPMADSKTLEAATSIAVKKEVDNILQNLEGYIDHVKRTKRTDDDSLAHAEKDANFNKYLGALKSLESNGYIAKNTVDENLDKWFADSPARMKGRPDPIGMAASEAAIVASIGQPGGPKDHEEAIQRIKRAQAVPKSERAALEANAIKQRLAEKNPKTGKPYSAWEVLQGLPRTGAPGEDTGPTGSVIQAASEDTNEPGFYRAPKTGQAGTTLSPMGGAKPKVGKVPRAALEMTAPKYTLDPKTGKPKDVHPFSGQKILSARAIMEAHRADPYSMTWDDVHVYLDNPDLFEDPTQHALLKQLIRQFESIRPRRRAGEPVDEEPVGPEEPQQP